MLLLLVRHGQTVGNIEGRIQGDDDPLTDLGRSQARTVAGHAHRARRRDASLREPARPRAGNGDDHRRGDRSRTGPDCRPGRDQRRARGGLLWIEWRDQNPALAEVMASQDRSLDAGWEGGENGRSSASG